MKEASSRGRIPFMQPRKYIGRDLYINGKEMHNEKIDWTLNTVMNLRHNKS